MGQWLTPDSQALTTKCYQVYLPDNDQMRAAFFGAYLLLCQEQNWEQFGTMTPDVAARWFSNAWLLTVPDNGNLEECP